MAIYGDTDKGPKSIHVYVDDAGKNWTINMYEYRGIIGGIPTLESFGGSPPTISGAWKEGANKMRHVGAKATISGGALDKKVLRERFPCAPDSPLYLEGGTTPQDAHTSNLAFQVTGRIGEKFRF